MKHAGKSAGPQVVFVAPVRFHRVLQRAVKSVGHPSVGHPATQPQPLLEMEKMDQKRPFANDQQAAARLDTPSRSPKAS
jgi:hypothetical protein